ncbi:MAG: hypothetical protein U1F49_20235 [Rubrivivax sp.]
MNAVSYDAISPNIAGARTDGAEVRVTWRCPATGRAVGESTASMAADPSLTSRVGASVKRSIASELIYGAARLVSNLVGGAAGRVISNAVYTAANDINTRATSGVDYSEASRQAAVVAAFETVKDSFAWDEKRRQFIAR